MTPSYRPARHEDIATAARIFVTCVSALAQSNGLPAPSYTATAIEPVYLHLLRSGIFEVAELNGEIVGFAAGIVRDELWFLAMFWVLPEHKLRGIGKPLLDRVWRRAEAAGAKAFATWSSIDFGAVSVYLKRGLLPAGPIFTFAGPVLHSLPPDPRVELHPLPPGAAAEIDRLVRGTARHVDHEYWRDAGQAGLLVVQDGRTLGYFYQNEGTIGPAAWLEAGDGSVVLTAALAYAETRAPHVKLIALGLNHTAIGAATSAGLRLISASHFLRSAPFGQLEKYLPSGPALF